MAQWRRLYDKIKLLEEQRSRDAQKYREGLRDYPEAQEGSPYWFDLTQRIRDLEGQIRYATYEISELEKQFTSGPYTVLHGLETGHIPFKKLPSDRPMQKLDANGKITITLMNYRYLITARAKPVFDNNSEFRYWFLWVDARQNNTILLSNPNTYSSLVLKGEDVFGFGQRENVAKILSQIQNLQSQLSSLD